MSPKLERPLRVWHLLLSVGVIVLGGAVSAGAIFTQVKNDILNTQNTAKELKDKQAQQEDSINRMDRNIAVIGQKLGVNVETPR